MAIYLLWGVNWMIGENCYAAITQFLSQPSKSCAGPENMRISNCCQQVGQGEVIAYHAANSFWATILSTFTRTSSSPGTLLRLPNASA